MARGDYVQESLDQILKLSELDDVTDITQIMNDCAVTAGEEPTTNQTKIFQLLENLRGLVDSLNILNDNNSNLLRKDFVELMIERMALANERFSDMVNFRPNNYLTLLFELNSMQDDKFFYLIDRLVTNLNLITMDDYDWLITKARNYVYQLRRKTSATVNVIFSITTARSADILIPRGTVIQTTNGQYQFEIVENVTITAGYKNATAVAKNQVSKSETTDLDGTARQNVVLDTPDIVTDSLNVKVNSIEYTEKSNFYLMEENAKQFVIVPSSNGKVTILFGDGKYGNKPNGSVYIEYAIGGGSEGNNVQPNTLTKVIGTVKDNDNVIVTDLQVRNPGVPTGGQDRESIEEAKQNIPIFLSTTQRSISREDFALNALSVVDVVRSFALDKPYIEDNGINLTLSDTKVLVYIVTETGRLTDEIRNSIQNMYDNERKPSDRVDITISEALFQTWDISGRIYWRDDGRVSTGMSLIKQSLANYFSFTSKDSIGEYVVDWGSNKNEIPVSKIIKQIENFNSYGILKVEIDIPEDALSVDQLRIPKLVDDPFTNLLAVDKNGAVIL